MPVLRDYDFDKLAARVVDQYLSGRAKLADAAAKEAMQAGLNPDQIERLAQAANTLTFLRVMDQRKQAGAGDLMHEFDPIDARQVIRIVIDASGVHVDPGPHEDMSGPHDSDALPDEIAPPPPMKAEPKDERPKDNEEEKEPEKKPSKEAAILRARKLAGVLEDEIRQASLQFEDEFDALVGRFKLVYNPTTYEAFEKDALAEHGDEFTVAILDTLRGARGLPALEKTALEKTAALADHHVSEDTPEMDMLEGLLKLARHTRKLERAVAWAKEHCA